MEKKKLHDMRGKQSNIFRLFSFDKEALIHTAFHRVLIVYSIFYGAVLLWAYTTPSFFPAVKWLTIILWILFTPQAYEVVKGIAVISSRGLAFGHLSKEYIYTIKQKYHSSGNIQVALTYFAMLLWAAGFVAALLWWNL